MRYLLAIILAAFLATPAYAASTYCNVDGPHNCTEQNEDQLVAITRNTIHQMQLTHDPHVFKTKNDEVLQAAAKHQALLDKINPAYENSYWRN